MLVAEAKQRLPVPDPREHRANSNGCYARDDATEQFSRLPVARDSYEQTKLLYTIIALNTVIGTSRIKLGTLGRAPTGRLALP